MALRAVSNGTGRVRGGVRGGSSYALPGPNFYVIGAYQQPASNHATWKARGINTLFIVPQGTTPAAWSASAVSNSLKQVRYPNGISFVTNPTGASLSNYSLDDATAFAADMASGQLLAAAFFDEPSDVKDGSGICGYGHGAFDPYMVDQILSTWRGHGVPTWLNELGNHIRLAPSAVYMQDFNNGRMVDWFAIDSYPVSDGRPWPTAQFGQYSTDQGIDLDRVGGWSGNRPRMTFIETCQQFNTFGAQITASEFKAQIYSSIIHGGFGHCYFSTVLAPSFSFDGTPAGILAAMSDVHSYIASIHDNVLMNTSAGGRRSYVSRQSALSGNAPSGLQLPYPFEGCEIATADGRTYLMLLNVSSASQTVTDSRWGLSSLTVPAWGFGFGYSGAEITASFAPPVYGLWSPAQKTTDITLSESNVRATVSADVGYWKCVRGDAAIGSRKIYFEFEMVAYTGAAASDNSYLGISETLLAAGSAQANTASAVAYNAKGGDLFYNFASIANLGAAAVGDRVCIAVDDTGTNTLFWVRRNAGLWNNNATANPATGVNPLNIGARAALYPHIQLKTPADSVRLRTDSAAWTYTAPSGFSPLTA